MSAPEPTILLALAEDDPARACFPTAQGCAPSTAALSWALSRLRRPFVVVLPGDRPELLVLAELRDPHRRVLSFRRPPGPAKARLLRAAFALPDLTIAPDARALEQAVEAGADPERTALPAQALCARLLAEPRRKPRRAALAELGVSLALDLAELSGALRLAEASAPDRGSHVVNYHRVLPPEELATYCRPQMAMAAPLFRAQVAALARNYGFTPVEKVKEPGAAGRVAITFDDGYEDNFRVAWPILAECSAPACIFLVTQLIGRDEALWWDRFGLALFAYWRAGAPPPLPAVLPVEAARLEHVRSVEEARALISSMISALNRASQAERDRAVAAAEALVGAVAQRTMLRWEEVAAMQAAGICFGGHTRSHVPLDEVPKERALEELLGSQQDLEARLGVRLPGSYALPRGRLGPLSEEELRGHGVSQVMTTRSGVNRPDRSLYVLRRDGRMLTLAGRHHPAKLRLELTGLLDRLRAAFSRVESSSGASEESDAGY